MPEYVYMTDLPRPDKAVIECRKPTTTTSNQNNDDHDHEPMRTRNRKQETCAGKPELGMVAFDWFRWWREFS